MHSRALRSRHHFAKPLSRLSQEQWHVIAAEMNRRGSDSLPNPVKISKFWITLCESFLPSNEMLQNTSSDLYSKHSTASFTSRTLECLPLNLRLLLAIGLTAFRFAVTLQTGKLFENLPRTRRQEIVYQYAFGYWSVGRKLFRPIRSLVLLAYYEDPVVLMAMSERNALYDKSAIHQFA